MLANISGSDNLLSNLLIPLIPWLVVAVVIWVFLLYALRRQNRHLQRARDHWQSVEAKLDRLIEIAERSKRGDDQKKGT